VERGGQEGFQGGAVGAAEGIGQALEAVLPQHKAVVLDFPDVLALGRVHALGRGGRRCAGLGGRGMVRHGFAGVAAVQDDPGRSDRRHDQFPRPGQKPLLSEAHERPHVLKGSSTISPTGGIEYKPGGPGFQGIIDTPLSCRDFL
jgi:hypothetical protein